MKMAKLVLFLFLICSSLSCIARTDPDTTRLLFIVQARRNYLIPFIESTLSNLNLANSNRRVFKSIKSINTFYDETTLKDEMRKGVKTYGQDVHEQDNNVSNFIGPDIEKNSHTKREIIEANKLLTIRINEFNDLLEYQFSVYLRKFKINTRPYGNHTIKDTLISLYYIRSSSIFIDPKIKDYKNKILIALKQVFPEANAKPKVEILSNIVNRSSIYYCSTLDSIHFDAVVKDEDGPKEDEPTCVWDILKGPYIPIRFSGNSQKFNAGQLKSGRYYLYFLASDGISNSDTCKIIIDVAAPPQISLDGATQSFTTRNYFFGGNRIVDAPTFKINIHRNYSEDAHRDSIANDDKNYSLGFEVFSKNKKLLYERHAIAFYDTSIYLCLLPESSGENPYKIAKKLRNNDVIYGGMTYLRSGRDTVKIETTQRYLVSQPLKVRLLTSRYSKMGMKFSSSYIGLDSKSTAVGVFLGPVFNLSQSFQLFLGFGVCTFSNMLKKFYVFDNRYYYSVFKEPIPALQATLVWKFVNFTCFNTYNVHSQNYSYSMAIGTNEDFVKDVLDDEDFFIPGLGINFPCKIFESNYNKIGFYISATHRFDFYKDN
jgi:hypothetical protein